MLKYKTIHTFKKKNCTFEPYSIKLILLLQVACTLSPIQTISQAGKEINIKTVNPFMNTDIKFTLEVPFKETTADGREVMTTAKLEGDTLTKTQVTGQDMPDI